MEKPIGFFISLALLTTMAVFATTRPNEADAGDPTNGFGGKKDNRVLVSDDLLAALSAHDELSTFSTLLRASGLARELSASGGYTICAPENAAFNALPAGTIEKLLMPEEKGSLISVLRNHILTGKFNASDLTGQSSLKTMNGQVIRSTTENDQIKIQEAKITAQDLAIPGGVLHVIDQVLLSANG